MTVLITGATRGIGRALFDIYTQRGVRVIGTCRGDPPEAGEWLELDVADPAGFEYLSEAIGQTAIDILVCNAGVYLDRGDRIGSYFADVWSETFAVNVTGAFLTVQAALPALRRSQNPRIAIISSQMGSSARASGGSYAYRASKAAAVNIALNLAAELAPKIAVAAYHPGWVKTDLGGGSSATITPEESAEGLFERFEELGASNTGRFLTWDGQEHPI